MSDVVQNKSDISNVIEKYVLDSLLSNDTA